MRPSAHTHTQGYSGVNTNSTVTKIGCNANTDKLTDKRKRRRERREGVKGYCRVHYKRGVKSKKRAGLSSVPIEHTHRQGQCDSDADIVTALVHGGIAQSQSG